MINETKLIIKRVGNRGEPLPLPEYATSGSSGLDLRADDAFTIFPGDIILVPTGVAFGIPEGHEIQIRSRSGLALKKRIAVFNQPATIDQDFTGEAGVILHYAASPTLALNPLTFKRGDRIAQAVLCPITKARIVEVRELEETKRGSAGYGSTGL